MFVNNGIVKENKVPIGFEVAHKGLIEALRASMALR